MCSGPMGMDTANVMTVQRPDCDIVCNISTLTAPIAVGCPSLCIHIKRSRTYDQLQNDIISVYTHTCIHTIGIQYTHHRHQLATYDKHTRHTLDIEST